MEKTAGIRKTASVAGEVLGLLVIAGIVWLVFFDPFPSPAPTPEETAQKMYDLGFRIVEENGQQKIINVEPYSPPGGTSGGDGCNHPLDC